MRVHWSWLVLTIALAVAVNALAFTVIVGHFQNEHIAERARLKERIDSVVARVERSKAVWLIDTLAPREPFAVDPDTVRKGAQ